ncbi:MAG: PSD1 and planctomycete cytochrome C domain-containing protein [Bryobacteraceae bacterium]
MSRGVAGTRTCATLLVGLLVCAISLAQPTPTQIEFFERRIRPVLVERCYECHGPKAAQPMSELRLDTRAGMLKGGERGPAIIPGDSENSRLIRAIRYQDPRLLMPPKGRLAPEHVEDFAAWIKMGAPDPRVESKELATAAPRGIDFARARKFWAFQPLKSTSQATVDSFLFAKLKSKGLAPAPPADRRTLLRRVYFDLIGLPPLPAEVDEFVNDRAPDAFRKVVARLLDSPHYGERWARHWLDLVRFAETDGHEFDVDKPNAWRYRDYVIRALNNDLPYNRFVREQIVGDLLNDRDEAAVGSGFLWLGEVINTPVDTFQARADRIDNQIDVFGKAFLGLTVACARCHDHKFDPIPAADYYALAGFMHSSRPRQASIDAPERVAELRAIAKRLGDARPYSPPPEPFRLNDSRYENFEDFAGDRFARWTVAGEAFGESPVAGLADSGRFADGFQGILISREFLIKKRYIHVRMAGTGRVRLFADEYTNSSRTLAGPDRFAWKTIDARMGVGNLAYLEISDLDQNGHVAVDQICFSDVKEPPGPNDAALRARPAGVAASEIPLSTFALATVDAEPRDIRVHIRGSHANLGAEIPRRFLTVLSGDQQPGVGQGSGRTALADRLLRDATPLLARVMVNRLWKHHFGRGLVDTVDNLGMTGERPTHPELLDYLALKFIESGWSVKAMHRMIVLSAAYRMSSRPDAKADGADPRNEWLHRMPIRRLEAEAIRDGVLAVAGTLDRKMYGPSVPPYVSPYMDGDPRGKPKSGPLDGAGRRSVYIQVRRNYLTDMFLTFDYPLPITTIGRRNTSTVASQALYLMNSEFITQQAEHWARRITAEESDGARRVRRMYEEAFARPPEAEETAQALEFVAKRSWADLAHVLINTTEFFYVR